MSLKPKINIKKFQKSIEIIPPRYKIDNKLIINIKRNQQYFDYLDIACCPMANLRISPISFAHKLIMEGVDHKKLILNFSTRDKNTLALQSEILGAYSMNINKILLVKGDPLNIGNSNKSKEVFEVSTNNLIRIVKNLDRGFDYSNNKLNFKTKFQTGSTINIDKEYNLINDTIKERIKLGSMFFVTQPLFTENDFELLVKLSEKRKNKIFAGILPIKNKKTLYNLKNKINGISKKNVLFEHLSKAKEKDFTKISTKYFVEILSKYKKYLDGVHIMTSGDIRLATKIAKII